MIQKESHLRIVDNSGALIVKCIGFNGEFNKSFATVNQILKVSVQSIRSTGRSKVDLKKGAKLNVLVVGVKKSQKRRSGFFFCVDQSDAILLGASDGKPFGTKIKGLLPKELRKSGNSRLLSISAGVL